MEGTEHIHCPNGHGPEHFYLAESSIEVFHYTKLLRVNVQEDEPFDNDPEPYTGESEFVFDRQVRVHIDGETIYSAIVCGECGVETEYALYDFANWEALPLRVRVPQEGGSTTE